MNSNWQHAFTRDGLTPPALYGTAGGLLGLLIFGWPATLFVANSLGIAAGFLLAAILFGRTGPDVWITPIVTALLLSLLAEAAFGAQPLNSESVITLWLHSTVAVALAQVGVMGALRIAERLRRK